MADTLDDYEEQREQLLERAEEEEQELRQAFSDLRTAVRRPFEIIDRLSERPLPWMLSCFLIGVWLGSRSGNHND